MLSTLIALSSLTFAQAAGGQGESVFPKPEARNPEVLTDRTVFQYLKDGQLAISAGVPLMDWSGLKPVEPKPGATKLRVLLLVFERDFVNSSVSNTLEMADKQRLILSMSRIRLFFSSMSAGNLDVEVVPRFIPEPLLQELEAKEILEKEFNKFVFDADDREERGPFAAVLPITSSRDSISFAKSFSSLGGSDPGTQFEQNLIGLVCGSLSQNVLFRYMTQDGGPFSHSRTAWPVIRKGVTLELFNPSFRNDIEAVNAGVAAWENGIEPQREGVRSVLNGPIELSGSGGILKYTEASIIRSGLVQVPGTPSGILEFQVRTKSRNPIGFQMVSEGPKDVQVKPNLVADQVTIGADGDVKITPDGTWQTVRIGNADGKSRFVGFGVTSRMSGLTRNPNEVIQYEFKEFKLVTESPSPLMPQKVWDFATPQGVSEAISSNIPSIQRAALAKISELPASYKSLQPKLLEMSTDLEPAVAFGAVQAYGKIGIANDDLIGKTFMNRLVATAPNEYAREAALLYFAEHPEQTTFEAIAPNIVRRSWRTRIATVKALAALDRTDLKAKPAARQLLLTATGQDMAIIRSAALAAMKAEVELERKQLEYSLVNDPSEQVRLQCLKQLANANVPKEVLFGSLADDSPYVREHVYEQLPATLQREALQRMVIDRDTYVRAAALNGFAKLPDPTQSGEIQNTFAEEHPAVLLALVEGAQKGKWKLPANVIETAKKSKSPLVREGVAKLTPQ